VWQRISKAAALAGLPAQSSLLSAAVELSTRFLSPYQFNPLAHNPLGDVLAAEIDFERLRRESPVQLIIATTAVRDGRPRYFANHEITLEAVLASACVPSLHQAVQIDGEWYWDGGFTANPPLVSLARLSQAQDLLLVQIIPGEDASLPTSSSQILRRVQQIAFNAPLRKELEQLVGMKELMHGEGRWASREELRRLQRLRLHRIVAENEVEGLAQASAMDLDWRFLTRLRDGGRSAADKWLRARHQSARPTHGSVPHIPLPPIGREEHES
jgi:NTE family protein